MPSRVELIALACTLLLAACSGDGIATPPLADGPTVRFDVISRDRGPTPDTGKPKELGPAADAASHDGAGKVDQTVAPGDGGGGGCSNYSAWTCKVATGTTLCTSTCGSDELACTNGGICQCGIGFGPCKGTYSGASPCDVCRAAWLGGCCL